MPGFLGRVSSIFESLRYGNARKNIIKDGYKIVVATRTDQDRVLELMRKTFLKDEPAIVGCGIKAKNLSESLQKYMVGDVSSGKALLAVSRENRLLAACIGEDLKPSSCEQLLEVAETCGDPRAATLLRFWAHLVEVSGLPLVLGTGCAWEVKTLATDPVARGLGLAKELTMRSREMARQYGYPALCVFGTSEFTCKLCVSLGMRHLMDVQYADYRDDCGRQIIKPPSPHTRTGIYVEDLSCGSDSTADKSDGSHSTRKR